VEQLLSEAALRKTGYFDPAAVRAWRERFRDMRTGSKQRVSVEMGLVGVISTQLWHQTFIDPTLADVPTPARRRAMTAAANGNGHGSGWIRIDQLAASH
jgi:hypothetical protein